MGFWYFLILFIGISLVALTLIKRSMQPSRKWTMLIAGIGMVALSLFMFQDGSAEIVDNLLKSMNIDL